MDRELDATGMLGLIMQPAFCVKDHAIVTCNQAARGLLFRPGMDIVPMLATGGEDYAEFTEGCLYLALDFSGVRWSASVTRLEKFDIFVLTQDSDQPELQAMALAARELREPLSKVLVTADQLFPMSALQDDEQTRNQVARLNRGLYQMLRVIGNMSDAAYFQTRPTPPMETLDIPRFLDEVFAKAAVLTLQAGTTLRFTNTVHSTLSLADREQLERAVLNIISNAMKFTPSGGTIEARLTRRGQRLQLSVQDSGEGIPAQIRGSIHSRYLRQQGIEDPRFGIGLGMVFIRGAAVSHGGTVLIDHPEDAGTRITMTLAIRQDTTGNVRSPLLRIDYTGERDHALVELSDALPASLYEF